MIAALMLLAPTTAIAENDPTWIKLRTGEGEMVMYVRSADISAGRSDRTNAKLWMKFDLTNPQGSFEGTAMVRYNVNCLAQTFQKMGHAYYMADNRILQSNAPENVQAVIPDSRMEAVIMALCSDSGKN